MKRRQAVGCALATLLLVLALSGRAGAQLDGARRQAAEALFQQGRELLEVGNYALACQRFESSQKLEPGLGTLLFLGECYDKLGKSTSAWRAFGEAAQLAARKGDDERGRLAQIRASALEPTLARLRVRVASGTRLLPSVEYTLNGVELAARDLEQPLHVDPGRALLRVTAPGHQLWETEIEILEGGSLAIVDVPGLAPLRAATTNLVASEAAIEPSRLHEGAPAPALEGRAGSGLRAAGIVVAVLGLGGIGTGSYFAVRAVDEAKRAKAIDQCPRPDRCYEGGIALRDDARSHAHLADLAAILEQRGRVDPVECVDWVLQACEGVAEAHSLRIVHRDLKPDNLFMTRLGDGTACIKVLDFGISKAGGNLSGSLTAPRTMVGSPRYMAPEQMLFSAADERSDVWALGTILYELASGTPVYAGDNVANICLKVINEPPVPPRAHAPEISAELQRVILRCLEREPSARYPSVAALAQDLAPLGSPAALDSSRKVAATLGAAPRLSLMIDPSATVTPTRAARQPRRWLWLAVAVAVAALLIGGPRLWRSSPQSSTVAVAQGSVSASSAGSAPEVARPASSDAPAPQAAVLPPQAAVLPSAVLPSAVLPSAVLPAAASPAGKAQAGTPAAGSSARENAGSGQTDKGLARRRPPGSGSNVPVSPDPQEAWDVRKFGGRE